MARPRRARFHPVILLLSEQQSQIKWQYNSIYKEIYIITSKEKRPSKHIFQCSETNQFEYWWKWKFLNSDYTWDIFLSGGISRALTLTLPSFFNSFFFFISFLSANTQLMQSDTISRCLRSVNPSKRRQSGRFFKPRHYNNNGAGRGPWRPTTFIFSHNDAKDLQLCSRRSRGRLTGEYMNLQEKSAGSWIILNQI